MSHQGDGNIHTASDDARVIAFYSEAGTDSRGRTLSDVWKLSLEERESQHDYIQWLFPTTTRSAAQPNSPVLSQRGAATVRASPEIQKKVARSAEVMAEFYGFRVERADGKWNVRPSPAFDRRRHVWVSPFNHNFLRQTRILTSLRLLGLKSLALAWFQCLLAIASDYPQQVSSETLGYWARAIAPVTAPTPSSPSIS